MARSVFTSNKDRCQKSLPFWKFFMNFLYSTAENPSEELLALRNDCMNSALDYNAKLEMYQLFIQYYSTICEDVANLKQMKLDYSIWKLLDVDMERKMTSVTAPNRLDTATLCVMIRIFTILVPSPL